MFIKGHRYHHDDCIDADVIVDKMTYQNHKYIKLKVLWVSGETPHGYDKIKIMREDLRKWNRVFK